ncbi:LCP family protein [Pontibacillus salipaludis]|uniref:LCP family glycopolymer transferase n=1 Tax=Pontibacillus salipaludis TaxID=1697394 RepID=UPI0031E67A99
MSSRQDRKKKKKKSRLFKISMIILAVLIVGGLVYAYSIYQSFQTTMDQVYEPLEGDTDKRVDVVSKKDDVKDAPSFSLLLLGVDERDNDSGRSDTMIVLTVNPAKESIKMLSIPRDTRTELAGRGTVEKINHAYAYGQVSMAVDTVEQFLDIPIDYYVKVNMQGFQKIVDAVGGVTVDNPYELSENGNTFPEGEITLDGEEALTYTRIRYADPRGDFGRQDRQKQIIQAVIDKGARVQSMWKFDSLFDAVGETIKTNLTFEEMVSIQKRYKGMQHNIDQMRFEQGTGERIDGLWYYLPSERELNDHINILQDHLGVDGQEDN